MTILAASILMGVSAFVAVVTVWLVHFSLTTRHLLDEHIRSTGPQPRRPPRPAPPAPMSSREEKVTYMSARFASSPDETWPPAGRTMLGSDAGIG